MKSCAAIFALSVAALVMGATVIGIFTAGPIGILAGPVLAMFGWFYLVPIALFVVVALAVAEYPYFQRPMGICLFTISGSVLGAVFMAIFGVKEEGSVVQWTIAYAVGGGISGAATTGLVVWLRRLPAPDAPTRPPR